MSGSLDRADSQGPMGRRVRVDNKDPQDKQDLTERRVQADNKDPQDRREDQRQADSPDLLDSSGQILDRSLTVAGRILRQTISRGKIQRT